MRLSIVVPVYNEEQTIERFYKEILNIEKCLCDYDIEFVFIDDGSTDGTYEILTQLNSDDSRVHFRSFSRNFGKEAAILAGLQYSTGDLVVTMDVDLQDPPSLLPEMIQYIHEGYDCVATRRSTRKGEPVIRSLFAHLFYKIINALSQTDIVDGARDYRLMTRKVVNAVCSVGEYNRFLKGIYGWVGFKTKWIEYKNIERCAGETKWSFWKLVLYSIEGIVAFSTVPLAMISGVGLLLCLLALIFLIITIVRVLCIGNPMTGWTLLVCVITFLGGLQILCLGVVGMYLSKTYLEVKRRPVYIVKDEK